MNIELTVDEMRIEELEKEIAELKEQIKNRDDTLKAWFDTSEKIESEIGPVFIDSMKSFLRTCENGGMPHKRTKIVLRALEAYIPLYLGPTLLPILRGMSKK